MRFGSLSQLLAEDGDSPKLPNDGDNYTWERLTYDASRIREHHNSRTKVGDVVIRGDIPREIRHYVESLEESTEAYEYDDGSILLCATCSEFAGTFASHNETEIHFFLLIPKGGK